MKLIKKKNIDFVFDLFERGLIPDFYSNIDYSHKEETLFKATNKEYYLDKTNDVFALKFVPSYLKFKLKNEKTFTTKKVFQFNGHAILLNSLSDANDYLMKQFKTKFRTLVKRSVNRLESCFDIKYKMFYGEISKHEYDFIMNTLKNMLQLRFQQRGEINERLLEWDHFHKIIYPLINEKKASFYVIYDNEKPIDISLNYHFEKIFFNAICSYDIDYAKFGLGHVDIYKQLDWCIANNYEIFDMGMGDMDYKLKWCNTVYDFEHQFIYSKNSIFASLGVFQITTKLWLKNYLKSKNIHHHYKKIRNVLRSNKNNVEEYNSKDFLKYQINEVKNVNEYKNLSPIDYHKDEFTFLRKIVYDFLYSKTEHISNTTIFKISGEEKTYLIKGEKHIQKVSFKEINAIS